MATDGGRVHGQINDAGGMQGLLPLEQEVGEPAFHADWEVHVLALSLALPGLCARS